MGLRVTTQFGGHNLTLEVNGGPLADALRDCSNASEVFQALAKVCKGEALYANARNYTFSCYSADVAWQKAHEFADRHGFEASDLRALEAQAILIEELDEA